MNKPKLRLVGGLDLKPKRKTRGTKSAPAFAAERPVTAFETVGRQKLHLAIWKGRGTHRPLLFFNGIGVNLELAAPLHEAFPDRDIVTFDMPGIGRSPAPAFPYRPWWAAHAAAKILDRYGYTGKVDVMGVSWGGLIAQQFAFQCSHRVNRIVLAATSPGALMVPGDLNIWGRLLNPRGFFDTAALANGFAGLIGERDGLPRGVAGKFLLPTPQGYAAQLFAMTAWTSLHLLAFIRTPALVMMGGRDRVVPLINGRILNALLPQSRLHIVKDAGHFFPVTRLGVIAPVIREFLDEDRLDRIRTLAPGKPRPV
jgi:poly(3-hydroxyalkanoate) depolymerase